MTMLSENKELHAQNLDQNESLERFERLFGTYEHDLTPEQLKEVGFQVALGNYAQTILDGGEVGDEVKFLKQTAASGEQAGEVLVDVASNNLTGIVKTVYEHVGDDRQRSASLLSTAVHSKQLLRNAAKQLDFHTDDPVAALSGMVEESLEAWLRQKGDYQVRPRRIKAHILTVDEQIEHIERMQDGDNTANGPLMESLYRLAQTIVVRDLLTMGKMPQALDVNDLAHEAILYAMKRIPAFDSEKGYLPTTQLLNYVQSALRARGNELNSVVRHPLRMQGMLYSRDPQNQLRRQAILSRNEHSGLQAAMNTIDEQVYRLEAGDNEAWLSEDAYSSLIPLGNVSVRGFSAETARKLKDSDRKVSDPEAQNEQEIGWREMLSDDYRIVETPVNAKGGAYTGPALEDRNLENLVSAMDLGERLDRIMEACLDEREKLILDMRFGLDGGANTTLADVGAALGISLERVRQLELKALAKMRSFNFNNGINGIRNYVYEELAPDELHERWVAKGDYAFTYGVGASSGEHVPYEPIN